MQSTVYTSLSQPIPGDLYDNSPRRADPYILTTIVTAGVKASGKVTAAANASANDTVSVAGTTYTFKAEASAATDVEIGDDKDDTLANLATVVNANNAFVTAEADSTNHACVFTAREAGTAGNAFAISASVMTPTSFSGGVNAVYVAAYVGHGFGFKNDNTVCAGDNFSKGFAGILVTSKQYSNINNLEATMEVKEGVHGELLTFGRVWVKTKHAVVPGYLGCMNSTTGEIGAASDSDHVPSGYQIIPNSKFILQSASVGEMAILQLSE